MQRRLRKSVWSPVANAIYIFIDRSEGTLGAGRSCGVSGCGVLMHGYRYRLSLF